MILLHTAPGLSTMIRGTIVRVVIVKLARDRNGPDDTVHTLFRAFGCRAAAVIVYEFGHDLSRLDDWGHAIGAERLDELDAVVLADTQRLSARLTFDKYAKSFSGTAYNLDAENAIVIAYATAFVSLAGFKFAHDL
jgi:hypothetical protein